MGESKDVITHSGRLRDAMFLWVPEVARAHDVRFIGRFALADEADTEFDVMYDPDDLLLDMEVYERSTVGFLKTGVELDAMSGEIHAYTVDMIGFDKKILLPNRDTEELLRLVGTPDRNDTITLEQEEFFLKILSGMV